MVFLPSVCILFSFLCQQVLSERLNSYFGSCQNTPALRGIIQYPQLSPLPGDFLATMEEYVKEAPRAVDPNAPAAMRRGGVSQWVVVSLLIDRWTRRHAFTAHHVSQEKAPLGPTKRKLAETFIEI
jgi:hypothetical protein